MRKLLPACGTTSATRTPGERSVRCALSRSFEAVPAWIGKRLHPVVRSPADLTRLIADLNADDFDRREAATKELAALGAQAGPALRKCWTRPPPPRCVPASSRC